MPNPIKQIQRESCLVIRSRLPRSYQQAISRIICQRITELKAYRQAKHIALYHAFNQEIDLFDIWHAAPFQGKFCYFPVITEEKNLLFLPATPKTVFEKNKYGILEPIVNRKEAIPGEQLDIIFMPLVAFDIFGTRLGMGAGYYDRTLPVHSQTRKIGLAYEFQKLDYIPPEPWDVGLTMVITEEGVYDYHTEE